MAALKKLGYWTGDEKSLPLPWNYSIPVDGLPVKARKDLEQQVPLNRDGRAKLLQTIYDDVATRFNKFYLDTTDYQILAQAVVRDYPYLEEGMNHDDAVYAWHKRMNNTFRNARKRRDRNHPAVKKRMKGSLQGALAESQPTTTENVWGLAMESFLPERKEDDDDSSIEDFNKFLKGQSKLKENRRDNEKIKMRMDSTFPDRRKRIVDGSSIQCVKETYRLLFCEHEIERELERLASFNVADFNKGLTKYADKIIKLPLKKVPDIVQDAKELVQTSTVETARKRAIDLQALVTVPYLLREDLDKVLMEPEDDDDDPCLHPYILQYLKDGVHTYSIFAEKIQICSTESLLKAFRLLMATFYVFNLAYSKAITGTLTFYQRVFLNLQDNSPKVPKMVKLMKDIIKAK